MEYHNVLDVCHSHMSNLVDVSEESTVPCQLPNCSRNWLDRASNSLGGGGEWRSPKKQLPPIAFRK